MTNELDVLSLAFTAARLTHDQGKNDLRTIGRLSASALDLLFAEGTHTADQGTAILDGVTKAYEIRRRESTYSRPIRRDLFIPDSRAFSALWLELLAKIDRPSRTLRHDRSDAILYTAVMSFAVCFDLYKPTSRKTPGTFFEVLVGALLSEVSGCKRAKQIALPDSRFKVTTDIVLDNGDGTSLVIPTKITTRERVVQAWVHQRILDDAFGPGRFRSTLVAVSELQRQGLTGVNEICVPGQIGLYQRYLAQLTAMYYLDPPAAYMTTKFVELIPTKRFSCLLDDDLSVLLST